MDQQLLDRINAVLDPERPIDRPPDGFQSLPRIPAGRYTDPEFLALEKESLWDRSWLYACHSDQLPAAGSFVAWEKNRSPIVIVRGKDEKVRAFYNTCQHRGGPLVKDASGTLDGGFICAFHGWKYDLNGSLVGVRDRSDFGNADFDCHGLNEIRCECFGNWIFVSEDPQAESLQSYLLPMTNHWQQFKPHATRHVASSSYMVECNCKMLLEAFLEVYHLRNVHAATVDRFLSYRTSRHVLWPKGHSLMVTPNRDSEWVDPGTKGMPEFPGVSELPGKVNVSYNVFPNLITPLAPTGIPFLLFWPQSNATTRVDCHWFSPDWGAGDRHELWGLRMRNFERILEEDLELAPYLQKSVESKGFAGGQLSFQERRIYHWHEELDRRIGLGKVPERLRVEPRMKDFIELPV